MNERRCEACGKTIDAVCLQYQPLTKTCTHVCSKKRAAKKLVRAENTILEYSKAGGTFSPFPYVGDISVSGGEAPETDIISFRRAGKLAGKVRVPSFSIAIPSYTPQLQAFKDIKEAIDDGDTLSWRLTTKKDTIFTNAVANDTVAIATTGIVTYAGTAPDFSGSLFGEGMVIKVGGANYVIDSISDATPPVVMVRPAPAAASLRMPYVVPVTDAHSRLASRVRSVKMAAAGFQPRSCTIRKTPATSSGTRRSRRALSSSARTAAGSGSRVACRSAARSRADRRAQKSTMPTASGTLTGKLTPRLVPEGASISALAGRQTIA